MDRGIVYFNVGNSHVRRLLVSLLSLRKVSNLPVCVLNAGKACDELVDGVSKHQGVEIREIEDKVGLSALSKKIESLQHTPFHHSLFLDADTIVVQNVDSGFDTCSRYDYGFVNFARWKPCNNPVKGRLQTWVKKGARLPSGYKLEDAEAYPYSINVGTFFYKKTPFLAQWLEYTIEGAKSRVFIPDEIFAQFSLPYLRNVIVLDYKWGTSPKHGPKDDPVIIHYHGDKHQSSYPLCSKWEEMDAELGNGADLTVVVAVDRGYLQTLRKSAQTWETERLFRQNRHKLHIITDGSVSDEELKSVFHFFPFTTSVYNDPKHKTQREKMIASFLLHAPFQVDTPFWVKLDADCRVKKGVKLFFSSCWRNYDIVSHRWRYTKPARWIHILEQWRSRFNIGKKPYDIAGSNQEDRIFKHKRFQSFVCFHNTEASRKMSIALMGSLPYLSNDDGSLMVPSHDTFYSFMAEALGLRVRLIDIKKWGFKHA